MSSFFRRSIIRKPVIQKFSHVLIPLFLFIGTLLIYKSIYLDPRNWYDHYLYLAKSILVGRVDIPNLPEFYQDKLIINGKNYLPFPPGASFVIIPFLLLARSITQQQISIIIGAFDIMLFYILISKFVSKKNAILLSLFAGFGTSFFWASLVGTTWFFAHIVAVGFLTLSLIFHFKKRDILSGIFLGVGALTRLPLVLAGIFFLLNLKNEKKRFFKFFISASLVFIPIFLAYNFLRFGNVFETGYKTVYEKYINSNYPVTIRQIKNPDAKYFGYMDIKNIPLNLYTLLVMPPEKGLKPSPYGMGIFFTSPLLLLAFLPPFKKILEKNLLVATLAVSIPSMLHYAQGWVQFGYRFLLDYLPFLILLLALKIKLNKFNLFLLVISIIVNFWGVKWAIKLGW